MPLKLSHSRNTIKKWPVIFPVLCQTLFYFCNPCRVCDELIITSEVYKTNLGSPLQLGLSKWMVVDLSRKTKSQLTFSHSRKCSNHRWDMSIALHGKQWAHFDNCTINQIRSVCLNFEVKGWLKSMCYRVPSLLKRVDGMKHVNSQPAKIPVPKSCKDKTYCMIELQFVRDGKCIM